MDDEIQLIRDGDGLAVIGNQAAVEHFLISEGLPSQALRPRPFRSALGNAHLGQSAALTDLTVTARTQVAARESPLKSSSTAINGGEPVLDYVPGRAPRQVVRSS